MRLLHETIEALAARLFAPHEEGAVDPADCGLGPAFFEYISDMETPMRLGLHALVGGFDLLSPLLIGETGTFRGLSEDQQDRVIEKMMTSQIYPLQMALVSLRTMLSIVFFDRSDVLKETGWDMENPACAEDGR